MDSQTMIDTIHSVIVDAIQKNTTFKCDTDGSTIWIDNPDGKGTIAIAINECVK